MLVKVTRDAGFKQNTAAPFMVALGIESITTAAVFVMESLQPFIVCMNNSTLYEPVYEYKCVGLRTVVLMGVLSP